MSLTTKISGSRLLVSLAGELTIFQAAETKPLLLDSLRFGGRDEIEIDLSQVSEIDTAGIQLMLMLKREAQRLDKTLTLTHHSSPVLTVVDLLNLGGTLGDPLLMSAGHGI